MFHSFYFCIKNHLDYIKMVPSWVICEIQFLRIVRFFLKKYFVGKEEDLKDFYDEWSSSNYKDSFGNTPVSTLLNFRKGIYKKEKEWFIQKEFDETIEELDTLNKKKYGDGYDVQIFQDDLYDFDLSTKSFSQINYS
jgi:hypothetical protein